MRHRKTLEARDPNTMTNAERNTLASPPLIDNLLKSNNTLRRLRAPLECTQQSSQNRQATSLRTSRWQRSKSETTNTKITPVEKSAAARNYSRPSSSASLTTRQQHQRQSQFATASYQQRSMGRTRDKKTPPKELQNILQDNKVLMNIRSPPATTLLSSQTSPSPPTSPLTESLTPLCLPQRPQSTSPQEATNRQLAHKTPLSYKELFASPDQSRQLYTPQSQSSPLFPFFESSYRSDRTEDNQQSQQSYVSSFEPNDGKSPAVYMLNDDCLTEIFQWCASTTTLCRLSSVCKHWRHIALQSYVWRTIDYTLHDFIKQQAPIYRNTSLWNRPLFSKRRKLHDRLSPPSTVADENSTSDITSQSLSCLTHTRTIRIDNFDKQTTTINHLRTVPDISPFTLVRTLRLSHVHFYDIVDLIDWYPNLQVLDCDKIRTLPLQTPVSLTVFNVLQQLRVLKLHFGSICELAEGIPFHLGTTTITTSDQDASLPHQQPEQQRWRLPSLLHTLAITNIYDIEECLTSGNSIQEASRKEEEMAELIQSWNGMEETLVRKYKMLTTLLNLTDLTLGNCTGFTARVWRECVAPCTTHLTRLSLHGWGGDGSRESPLLWQARHHRTESFDPPDGMEDVEMALAEVLTGSTTLESLSLAHFNCSPGLIHGITKLAQTQSRAPVLCYLHATNGKQSTVEMKPSGTDIKALLDWTLHKTEIKFKG